MHPGKKPATIVQPTAAQFSSFDCIHTVAQKDFFQRRKATVRETLEEERLILTPGIVVGIGMSKKPGPLAHPGRMGQRKAPPGSTANRLVRACRRIAADDLAIPFENHGAGSQQVNVTMLFKELNLPFKTLRIRHIVGIHSGDILSPREMHTLIQP